MGSCTITNRNIDLESKDVVYYTETSTSTTPSAINADLLGGSSKADIISLIYPIGSVYISVANINPSQLFGGVWQEIGSGKVLQGADENHAAGTTIEAGLPNISGSIGPLMFDDGQSMYANAPFAMTNGRSRSWSGESGNACKNVTFDMSRVNSIYGNSDTVQPPAYCVYMWKRIA